MRLSSVLRTALVALWAVSACLLGPRPGEAADAPVSVVLQTLDAAPVSGRLGALHGDRLDLQTDAGPSTVALGRVVSLSFPGHATPSLAGHARWRVGLVGGDVLVGRPAHASSDGITLDSPDLGKLAISFDAIRTIVPVPEGAGVCYQPQHVCPGEAGQDAVYTTTGDETKGILDAATDEGFELQTEAGRTRTIPYADVRVVQLQNPPPPPAEGLRVEVETVEGSRLVTTGGVEWKDGALALVTRSLPGHALRVPLERVTTLRPDGGPFVYATEVPFRADYTSYYGEDDAAFRTIPQFAVDCQLGMTTEACPLKIHGVTYRHGFGTFAGYRIHLELGGHFARFRTLFGVDDRALGTGGGDVDARVIADGKTLWEAKDLKAGDAPSTVGPLDVRGVKDLTLEVGYGPDSMVGDYASWADPILERP